jgi:ADP-ribose pyrophosphatase YjhB (NUDIX family)
VPRPDWRHCPRCAEPLTFGPRRDEARDVLHCTSCGLVIYENPAPTASGLVLRDGRLMLTRRARPPGQGMWDVPGGFIDPLEHPEDALRRELLEETGLEIVVGGDVIAIYCDVYGEGGVATLNLFYIARVAGGIERPADDVSEIGWFAASALPAPEQIAFQNGRDAVAELVARGLLI